MSSAKYTNALIHETSPYLLQHAHNPVNWQAWHPEVLQKGKQDNKLLLISIGYSSCHWCHVMERECFENEEVAELMNKYFICIKIDREERPDIDQIYMQAVQLMAGQGGWPLNCFTLPDQRPVYGGTYFPKAQWIHILKSLHEIYTQEPDKMYEYAERLTAGINQMELLEKKKVESNFSIDTLHKCIEIWQTRFDNEFGGPNKAPKFPLPNNYIFLLRYAYLNNKYVLEGNSNLPSPSLRRGDGGEVWGESGLLNHIYLTLDKMAMGGIFDQIGGGFARYSTDVEWKVPHFEKMLYDNAQLLSLYAEAYQYSKSELYKEVVEQTIEFLKREMKSPEGLFYSALDADSEGVEGKYYVWQKTELQQLLGDEYNLFAEYYNINETGYWEHDNYILLRTTTDNAFATKQQVSLFELKNKRKNWNEKLLAVRNKRIKPGLDDKCLTSWNALCIKGLTDSYLSLQDVSILDLALHTASFIETSLQMPDGGLYHSYKNGKASIEGFLEDYAFTAEAYITLYEATGNEAWVTKAKNYLEYCFENFYDSTTGMFYFTSQKSDALIARKHEISDNVTPASNSSLAISLFYIGTLFEDEKYLNTSKQMLTNVLKEIETYGSGYSNWGQLLIQHIFPFYEIAIVGTKANEYVLQLSQNYIPNKLFITSTKGQSNIPLLKDKLETGETTIYVCNNKTCTKPVTSVHETIEQLK